MSDLSEVLTNELNKHAKLSRELIKVAEADLNDGVDDFVAKKIGKLFKIVSSYKDLFEKFGLKSKADFENLLREHYRNEGVRDASEDFYEAEASWDSFLRNVDTNYLSPSGTATVLTDGQPGPLTSMVTDSETGREGSLATFLGSGRPTLLVLLRHFA